MGKTREIVCIYYLCEHNCNLGKDAVFRGLCQTCSNYVPKRGMMPARSDKRREKLEKIKRREMRGDY